MSLRIAQADPRRPDIRALLAEHHALMRSLFPAEDNHFLEADALATPDIRFFLAEAGAEPAGCGALALRDGYGEVKSMFVRPAERGTGVGRALLAAIEAAARAEGLPLLRLETGNALAGALRLYVAAGFRLRGAFGAYREGTTSVFMEKPLAP